MTNLPPFAPATLHPFEYTEACAQALSQHCLTAITRHCQTQTRPFHLGLSGGKTPVPFFKHLARALQSSDLPLSQICLWWCDERAVPPDHPDSNYALVATHLLTPLQGLASARGSLQIQRLHGEAPSLAQEAARYAQALESIGALDYAVLGMGEDGHTASLFPGQPEASAACFVSQHPDGEARITLSSHFLRQSHQQLLLWHGPQKQNTWQSAQHSQDSTRYPILRIQAAGKLQVFYSL